VQGVTTVFPAADPHERRMLRVALTSTLDEPQQFWLSILLDPIAPAPVVRPAIRAHSFRIKANPWITFRENAANAPFDALFH